MPPGAHGKGGPPGRGCRRESPWEDEERVGLHPKPAEAVGPLVQVIDRARTAGCSAFSVVTERP